MKNTILYFTVIFFLLSVYSNTKLKAQNKIPPQHFVGVKGGAIYSTISLDVSTDHALVLNNGITGGIVYRYFSQKQVGIQLELNYTEKGGIDFFEKSKLPDTTGAIDYTYFNLNLKYIEFPFLMHMRIGKKNHKLKFNLGSHIGYNIYENLKFEEDGLDINYKKNIDSKFEFGFIFGIGYGYSMPKGIIDFEVRYSLGLNNIYKVYSINSSTTNQNQAVMATISYLYHVNNKKKKGLSPKIK